MTQYKFILYNMKPQCGEGLSPPHSLLETTPPIWSSPPCYIFSRFRQDSLDNIALLKYRINTKILRNMYEIILPSQGVN